MPHITEGLLHAHLDGALGPDEQLQWAEAEAHLEECDDCRRRLAEVAELRAAARDLLAAAAPAGSATRPAFAELAARAAARRADPASSRKTGRTRTAWWRRPATLGWAASLVIAAGAGWIGRQLVVEQDLAAPRAAAESERTTGRAEADEGRFVDETDGAGPAEMQARPDAAAADPPAAAPESSRHRANEDAMLRQGVRPEARALQEKAEPPREPEAREEADMDVARDAIRMRGLGSLAAVADSAPGAARCYAESAFAEAADDGVAMPAGQLEMLRLAADGTASLRVGERPMVGFWERVRADTLHLRATDGVGWREFILVEAEDAVHGDAELAAVACP